MSTLNTNPSHSVVDCVIQNLLRSTKRELEDVTFGSVASTLGQDEIDTIVRDALEVTRLAQSWRNRLAPISKIPPEVLTLIPGFINKRSEKNVVLQRLTHVCSAWRAIFTSCSSLWTDFDCTNTERTCVYIERSKSSPLNLRLDVRGGLFSNNPFFHLTPHTLGRVKSLSLAAASYNLRDATDRLSCPAPLLEELSINCDNHFGWDRQRLSPTLFNGDLSSLRRLRLEAVPGVELPWRNMINLTSLTLSHTSVPMGWLLDFFEGASNLLDVVVIDYHPDPSDEHERLVSLAHLRSLHIYGRDRIFPLLEHLLIPVGATVATDLHTYKIWEHHSAKSIKNLRNFSNFTAISLLLGEYGGSYKFTGPNGEVVVRFVGNPRPNSKVARSLAQLDTSQTERLEISYSDPLSEDLRQVLLSMRNLRRLTLYLCQGLCSFLLALNPETNPANPTPFPKLETLYLRVGADKDLDFGNVVEVAAARASRGVPFKSIKIIKGWGTIPREGEIELRKHVSRVRTVTGIGFDSDDGSDNDEED